MSRKTINQKNDFSLIYEIIKSLYVILEQPFNHSILDIIFLYN